MATLQRRRCPRILAHAGTIVMLLLLELLSPALSLVVNGTIFKGCSRECESRHCQDPIKLRYGKYCGIGYTGCESEVPCDGIDSCCKSHDICIGPNLENYVNRTCNDQLKKCVEKFQDSNMTQFNGSTCSASAIEEVIITSMNIATLGKSVGIPSSLPNTRSYTALVFNSFMVLLLGGW
ncbi:phospholipase A2-alpha isoform X1 [Physcomitrium patens]|uniref:Uncharacterized protein n=1 Tax=Physcomitrium patens TaxID=3218 RepID=A0A2K1ISP3_PHYPA|nr:phospholipase A2-alpha-like [Physcomitrium patens]PNR32295.1 hypothetical protein PHYPA_026421 [Physcomitrium patens]|eukprot:XP_024358604.1 phospholipase A2-alpha-like [Physcomitrella patens]